jgi:hypothetical protein
MKRMIIAAAMCLSVVSAAAIASADTLVLKDGTRIEGTVVGVVERTITFRRADGVSRQYPASQVDALEFPTAERAIHRSPGGHGLVVPAGTELVVRTVETIDSRDARTNQTFAALVEQEIENTSGHVIVPEGSHARLIIRHLSSGSKTGSPEMALDIQSIVVEGRTYQVNTTDLTLEGDTGIGKNKRTAETTGGGALLGTIIGAIAGGGKGAAIGAVVGAAGGASVQVLTRGKDVRVPAETILRFRLDRDVALQPER